MTTYTLFTDVASFYTALETAVAQAQDAIFMAYYAFDDGEWARRLAQVLQARAAAGVSVHLMVDEAGLYLENARNVRRNRQLLSGLVTNGVHVDLFRPHGRRLSQFNRLHCKFCAVDERVAFLGGSNIGDHYPGWRDTNLRLTGALGDGLARLYTLLCHFGGKAMPRQLRPETITVAGLPVQLTMPGHRQDIRRALLDLILSAETAVSLRSWYFLPDPELLNALLSQAERGIRVNILFSHRTRIPPIDLANRPLVRRLVSAGAHVYRYAGCYMHAKEAWNDQGDVLLGSANIDRWALKSNFECCLLLHEPGLARQLDQAFQEDKLDCLPAAGRLQRPLRLPQYSN